MTEEYDLFSALYCDDEDDMAVFRRWTDERLLEQWLKKERDTAEEPDAKQNNHLLARAVGPYDTDIAAGQIRVLAKRYVDDEDYIPYVAVIEEWEPGIWLILPFSPYSTPATPNEMETGLGVYSLEVLQAWNGRTVPGVVLEKSWLAGEMEGNLLADAAALFRHALSGKALPEGFARRRGPIIRDRNDPRVEYLGQFARQYNPMGMAVRFALRQRVLSAEAAANERLQRIRQLFQEKRKWESVWAAGEKESREHGYCLVPDACDFEGMVRYEYDPKTQRLSLHVYGTDRKKSTALDGMGVFASGAELLGIIMNGAFAVEPLADFDALPLLSDSEGNSYSLEPEIKEK